MARKQKSSSIEDLMTLTSLMPWWAGCILALVFYLVLHRFAIAPVAPNFAPGQAGVTASLVMWRTLASIGQYVLPIACLIGAVVSSVKRHKRQELIQNITTSKSAESLEGVSWQEFELLVGEAFRLQGYQVAESGGGGADGGIDLILRKNGDKFLVQCKQWKSFTVGVTIIRELYGVMAADGAAGGFVVTSGQFTRDAQEFAKGRNITLVNGKQLFEMIRKAKAARVDVTVKPLIADKPFSAPVHDTKPTCPICAKPMVQRTAKKGVSAGNSFWGCSSYPACRGTRQIE